MASIKAACLRTLPPFAAILLPITALDIGITGHCAPCGPRIIGLPRRKKIKGAIKLQRGIAPFTIGDRNHARAIGRVCVQ